MTTSGVTPTSSFAWRSFSNRLTLRAAHAGEGIISLLYPRACVLCDCPLGGTGVVCERCEAALPKLEGPRCRGCGEALDDPLTDLCLACGTRERGLDRFIALGPYSGGWDRLVRALKFERERAVGRWLSGRMAAKLRRSGLASEVDLVTFVPMTSADRRARTFNQAGLLARGVARELDLPVVGLLEKVRRTRPQSRLPAAERRTNLREAFRLLRFGTERILLVDDICTTGATLEACARELKRGGYRSVVVLTTARA